MTTPSKTDLEPSELLVCAREKNSSRLTGTALLRDLFQELNNLIPVDKLYVQIQLSDGSITLREVGSIGLEFFPAHASLSSSSSFEETLEQLSALGGSHTSIAEGAPLGATIPLSPNAPPRPKDAPQGHKKPKPMPHPKPASKKATKGKQAPFSIPQGAVPTQNGHIAVEAVTSCPPEKVKDYSKFGKSKH